MKAPMTADRTLASHPMIATSLRFGYDEPQDRLIVLASNATGEGLAFALTRRLTGRLINGLCVILERTSISVSKAPADLRDDVILLEHQGALSAQGAPQPQSPAPQVPREPARLVTRIEITTTPIGVVMTLRDPRRPLVRLNLTRIGLHRMLEVLSRNAEAAAWNIAIDASWLEPGQKNIVFN